MFGASCGFLRKAFFPMSGDKELGESLGLLCAAIRRP
jgi:hypothetical protein